MWNYLFIVWNIVNARQILRRGQALTGDCESWVSFPDPHKSAFLCPGMTLWFTFSKCEFELKQWRIWVHLNTFLVPAAHCVNLRDMGLSRAQATPDSHPEASSGHAQEAGRARTPRSIQKSVQCEHLPLPKIGRSAACSPSASFRLLSHPLKNKVHGLVWHYFTLQNSKEKGEGLWSFSWNTHMCVKVKGSLPSCSSGGSVGGEEPWCTNNAETKPNICQFSTKTKSKTNEKLGQPSH